MKSQFQSKKTDFGKILCLSEFMMIISKVANSYYWLYG